MSDIRNTSNFDEVDRLVFLVDGWSTQPRFIEEQEAAGQRQLVASEQLPTEMHGGTQADFEALGFVFGDVTPGDPLFRAATLPAGWRKRAMDHAMGSEILDELGRQRVSIFYKAAFYDRRADMSLVSTNGYVWRAVDARRNLILDDTWLTVAVAVDELRKVAARALNDGAEAERFARTASDAKYWHDRAAEHMQAKAFAEALVAQIGGAS